MAKALADPMPQSALIPEGEYCCKILSMDVYGSHLSGDVVRLRLRIMGDGREITYYAGKTFAEWRYIAARDPMVKVRIKHKESMPGVWHLFTRLVSIGGEPHV